MATSRATSTPPSLPAVIDLGRRIAALSFEYQRQEEVSRKAQGNGLAQQAAQNAMAIIDEQGRVLRELITTLPARSMADAAVQVAEAYLIAENPHANVHPTDEVESLSAALTRLLLSVLPLVAEAAGLDPAAMDWEHEVGALRSARFAGLEGVS